MADRKRKSWDTFKNEMKAKGHQTGDGVGKKNEEGNVLEREELVVQRLSYISVYLKLTCGLLN